MLIDKKALTQIQVANLSGYIRQNPGILILEKDLERLGKLQTPSVAEKGANLLIALGKQFPEPGATIVISCRQLNAVLSNTNSVRAGNGEYPDNSFPDPASETSKWLGVASASSPDELVYLFDDFLMGQRLVAQRGTPGHFVITPLGWQHIAELRHTQSKSTKAFVAMSFAPELRDFFIEGIEPGIRASGYEALRIDRTEHNNRIDDEIIAAIRQTKFLVADFTHNRGGVYFEAGFAKGLGREVIWSVREDHLAAVHFDTRQYNFIRWQTDALPDFAKALQNRIEATVGKGPLTTDLKLG